MQGFISNKSRLSKKTHTHTSIPRLEVIAPVMVANLTENITNPFQRFKVTTVHGWSDSMVVLHWLKGNGTYKQFVQNCSWGSWGYNVDKLPKKGLGGPICKEEWLMQKDIEPIKESKLLKEVLRTAKLDENQVDVLVIKFEF